MDFKTVRTNTNTNVRWEEVPGGKFRVRQDSPVKQATWWNCIRCGADFKQIANERLCEPCQSRPKKSCETLSFREMQVCNLVADAKLNKEIAYELHLQEGTVKEYINRIFRKCGLTNRVELAVWILKRRFQNEQEAGCPTCRQRAEEVNAE